MSKATLGTVTLDDVRTYLEEQSQDALVGLLMEQAQREEGLRRSLQIQAAKRVAKGLDLKAYRRAIDDAVQVDGYVTYREASGYASDIEGAIDPVEELLGQGHAAEAIDLCEYALAVVERAIESVDDSDGGMSVILERLQELHLTACRKAKPDPEELAERLFDWEMRTQWDTFHGAAERYAEVLGREGLAAYRQWAEIEWEKVPFVKPGQKDPQAYGKRFRITHIMETLARVSGSVDEQVAIQSRDLSSAYAFLRIAETLKQAKRHDEAVDWAERGVKAFPQRTDPRLREFLAGEYHRRKRHEEAMTLIWASFEEAPWLAQYQALKSHADRCALWPLWRERALICLRKKLESSGARNADRSTLVQIFLWEKDLAAAWCEAAEGGCSDDLWMKLADLRESDHPADTLAIVRKRIEPVIGRMGNDSYAEAVRLLRRVNRLMLRLGQEADFMPYLQNLRARHKPKRNLQKLLDTAKWV